MKSRNVDRRRIVRAVAALCLCGLGGAALSACASGGPRTITVSAVFSNVSDLGDGSQVQFAELPVGSVKSVTLDGAEAKVAMSLEKSADVPANVSADLEQTTILGEHYVDLVSPNDSGPPLANGAVITHTEYVPDLQQLVSSGTELFGAINAADLSQLVDNGAQGFGDESAQLRELLDDFSTVLGGYATRSGEIQSVIDNLDKFSAALAPDAEQNAQAISNLAQTTQVLSQQSSEFEQLLQSLDDLAVQGRSILDTGVPQTEDQLDALGALAHQLEENQQGLAQVLEYLPGHNETIGSVIVNNYVQILDDLIVCGIPGGGTAGNYPSNTCGGTG